MKFKFCDLPPDLIKAEGKRYLLRVMIVSLAVILLLALLMDNEEVSLERLISSVSSLLWLLPVYLLAGLSGYYVFLKRSIELRDEVILITGAIIDKKISKNRIRSIYVLEPNKVIMFGRGQQKYRFICICTSWPMLTRVRMQEKETTLDFIESLGLQVPIRYRNKYGFPMSNRK